MDRLTARQHDHRDISRSLWKSPTVTVCLPPAGSAFPPGKVGNAANRLMNIQTVPGNHQLVQAVPRRSPDGRFPGNVVF